LFPLHDTNLAYLVVWANSSQGAVKGNYSDCQKFFLTPLTLTLSPPPGGEGIRGRNFCQAI
jgi:hypothetical protein